MTLSLPFETPPSKRLPEVGLGLLGEGSLAPVTSLRPLSFMFPEKAEVVVRKEEVPWDRGAH